MSGTDMQPLLVLLWRSLGPYHLARAAAARAHLQAKAGMRTIALQLSDRESTHAWQVDGGRFNIDVRTVAPGAALDAAGSTLVKPTLLMLDDLRPRYLAIAGYDRAEMRAAARWARRSGAASILMSETKWDDSPRPAWKQWILRHLVRRFDAALVSGSAAGEFLIAMGLPRSGVFRHYGAVDNDFFGDQARRARERRIEPRLGMPPKYFLVCSRLIESRKNLRSLLLAYERYRAAAADPWALVLCGDGPDRSRYEQLVRERQIDGVCLEGFKQIDDLGRYYAHATCLVHPARREAWGLVVNEAMASGLPVIVSRTCGAAYDLVQHGRNGLCFDPDDPGALTQALIKMAGLSDQERRSMGQASQAIVADWGIERFADGLFGAIEYAKRRRPAESIAGVRTSPA